MKIQRRDGKRKRGREGEGKRGRGEEREEDGDGCRKRQRRLGGEAMHETELSGLTTPKRETDSKSEGEIFVGPSRSHLAWWCALWLEKRGRWGVGSCCWSHLPSQGTPRHSFVFCSLPHAGASDGCNPSLPFSEPIELYGPSVLYHIQSWCWCSFQVELLLQTRRLPFP